jgi:hypothetical protein
MSEVLISVVLDVLGLTTIAGDVLADARTLGGLHHHYARA